MMVTSTLLEAITAELNGRRFTILESDARVVKASVQALPNDGVLIHATYTHGERSSSFEFHLDEIPPYEDQRPASVASAIAQWFVVELAESLEATDRDL